MTLCALTFSFSATQAQGDEENNQQQQQMQMQKGDTDVSDKELKQFASTMQDLQQLRRQQMPKMRQAIKDAGLTMQKYRTLQQKMSGGRGQGGQNMGGSDKGESDKVTAEQKEKYQEAQQNVKQIQKGMQKEMTKTIQEANMSQQRFREISNAVRSDKALQKRMRKMQKQQSGGGRQPQGR